jgi:DNA-binding MurR/RpiR family transcriptional regulator
MSEAFIDEKWSKTTEIGEQSGIRKLDALLRDRMAGFSRSERRLATYFLNNLSSLQFETGASIARSVSVSEMTVSRFIRTIGFANLKELKQSLSVDADARYKDVEDYIRRFQLRGPRQKERRESLRLELEAVAKAYALASAPQWDEAMDALVAAETIYVVAFQASRGMAMDLASRLLWMRPQVVFVGSDSSTYGEVLMADPRTSVVVLLDTATYASRAARLAERLKAQETPLVIITDKFSLWGWSYSRWVFEAHTYVKTFWDSTAGLAVLVNLLLDGVATRLGPQAKAHYQRMADAGQLMGDLASRHGPARRE